MRLRIRRSCGWPIAVGRELASILPRFVVAVCLVLSAVFALSLNAPVALAIDKADAASGPPMSLAVFVTSRDDQCFDNGRVKAIKHLALAEQERINASGGVHGRPLDIKFYDDMRDDKKAVANMRQALGDPTLLAMIGLSSSSRGKAVFDAMGPQIGASQIPFLSDLSVSGLFNGYANIYTTRPSQDEVRAPVMVEFTRAIGYVRPAFLGRAGSVFFDALGDSLKKLLGEEGLSATFDCRARTTRFQKMCLLVPWRLCAPRIQTSSTSRRGQARHLMS